MSKLLVPCFILVSLVACGCNRNKSDSSAAASAAPSAIPSAAVASAAPSASASAAPSAAAADSQAAPTASQIPTQEDYEKKAKAVVTSKSSAAQELSKIEKEIGQ